MRRTEGYVDWAAADDGPEPDEAAARYLLLTDDGSGGPLLGTVWSADLLPGS